MMAPAVAKSVFPPIVSETARERETFTFDDLGISSAALQSASPAPDKLIPTSVLSSTPDPALTAFAQLGLYRLNATHSIVSLFDRMYQHFVAEAVRCAPLCQDGEVGTEPEGPRVFCGTAIPRTTSICEHVLTEPAENASIPGNGAQGADNLPVSVIPNLDLDPRFCYFRDKDRRFYAGVPIRSPSGINIGVYCVLDNKPRPAGLTEDQVRFARDISQTIMDYLHAKRSNEWYRREERMVRGLGSFVEGQATLSNWSDCLDNSSFRDLPGVQEGALNKKLQAIPYLPGHSVHTNGQDLEDKLSHSRWSHGPAAKLESQGKRHPTGSISSISSSDFLLGDVERIFSKASNIIRESIEVEGVLALDATVRSFGGLVGNEVYEPPILESISSNDSSSDEEQAPLSANNTSTDQNHCTILGFSTSAGSSINGHSPAYRHTMVPERLLQRLLQRYPHGRIFNFEPEGTGPENAGSEMDEMSSPFTPMSAGSLHPFGPDDEATRAENLRTSSRSHQNLASCLLEIFPGARSLAFVPLFDGQKHRWFAGGFAWTKTPTRIFTVENELSYLRVFGLTAMAEVGRLNTKAADKTKTDILGSISHELRSPLHGVVGSVELLRNTVLDPTQESILRIIETSGRTLLDTIDHLLDYSKVNNIVRSASYAERARQGRQRQRRDTNNLGTLRTPALCVHLDKLVEEVVESVLAGWSYRNMSDAHFSAWHSMMQGSPKPSGDSTPTSNEGLLEPYRPSMPHARNRKPVQIYLDIDHTVNWSFSTHPGAFRRIVLNLFGNSLKFTRVGFIRVSLYQEWNRHVDKRWQDGHHNVDPQQTKVILVVADSGKGISQEYLNNHIFTPFSQEDHFAPGTGLGLSLVRQMAVSLGGTIDVVSQVGQGTTMTVTLPLSPYIGHYDESPNSSMSDDSDSGFGKHVKDHLAGRRIHLRGFEDTLVIRDGALGVEDRKQKTQLQLLGSICNGWLKMNVVLPHGRDKRVDYDKRGEERDNDIHEDDFVLCLMKDHTNLNSLREGLLDDTPPKCPRLVVCLDSNAMYALNKPSLGVGRGRPGVSYIAQPIGPRKLAQALVSSRLQWKKSRYSTSDTVCPLDAETTKPGIAPAPITKPPRFTTSPRPLFEDPHALTLPPVLALEQTEKLPDDKIASPRPRRPTDTRDHGADATPPAATMNSKVHMPQPVGLTREERRWVAGAREEDGIIRTARTLGANAISTAQNYNHLPLSAIGEGDTRSILIVDDNPINLKILAAYMIKLHHPHLPAMNGAEAMQLYTAHPERFRCIVTDISMPVMDGLESTRRIREFERAHRLKPVTVIALTGLSGDEIQQDAFVSGVDLFLTRPLIFKGLERALEVTGHGMGHGAATGDGDGGRENGEVR